MSKELMARDNFWKEVGKRVKVIELVGNPIARGAVDLPTRKSGGTVATLFWCHKRA